MQFTLLQTPQVINIGLASFGAPIRDHGGSVCQIQWRPSAEGDENAGLLLAQLMEQESIETANQKAYRRYLDAAPILKGIGIAGKVIPTFKERMLLHAGPPITWESMCGPQKGAVLGAILFEGWANDLESAEKLVESGKVTLDCCHHHGAVGPMAGVISPSMPVWQIYNSVHDNWSYCNLNEGLGKVLRFGANDAEVLTRLHWMKDVLFPTLDSVLKSLGDLELKPLMARALHMGDEVHNRNAAASALFFRTLTVAGLSCATVDSKALRDSLRFIAGNDHFFLNLSMAACKAMLDAADGVENATLVTAMARNGVDFGIRISGLPKKWFTAEANLIDGLFFPGYQKEDAARDLGDSAITETAGLGGFSMAASPAIAQFVGGSPSDAIANTIRMGAITVGQNPSFTLPPLNFAGAPSLIDARKVVDTSISPVINTGIAHKAAGVGQIGAGITHAPLRCFTEAVVAFAQRGDFHD